MSSLVLVDNNQAGAVLLSIVLITENLDNSVVIQRMACLLSGISNQIRLELRSQIWLLADLCDFCLKFNQNLLVDINGFGNTLPFLATRLLIKAVRDIRERLNKNLFIVR
ncbi:hypothetical protein OAZ24_02015 [Synechococcus sp. AH-736-G21]|nr:hypothetical protein [Synechococcus sp. AH-736-G21]